MRSMRYVFITGLALPLFLSLNAWSENNNIHVARPGSINYVEGSTSIDGAVLATSSVGSAELAKGQTLATQAGKVEVLLTPGVFLRLADNSSLKMVSPDLANTEVDLQGGLAIVEAVDIHKENDVRIDVAGVSIRIEKDGLYEFDADHSQVRVFKGEAAIRSGNHEEQLKSGHMLTVTAGSASKDQHFESRQYEDEFYRWSALRSAYLSEASIDQARTYIGTGPALFAPGWAGWGWYWNPWFGVYTFVPADGVFWSPFGWGFYSPVYVFRSPFFYGYHFPHPFNDFHGPYGHGFGSPRSPGRR